jgi:uncharacterized membrane protein (UPF0127 family)
MRHGGARRAQVGAIGALLVFGTLIAACSSDEDPAGTTATTVPATGGAESPGEPCAELHPIGDFDEVEVAVGDDPECLLLAQTPEERARGLMEVTDLAGYPGMLFAFPEDSNGGFWMRNTPTPLSIAYLDADGRIVSTADMDPCDDVPSCPSYPADAPYRFTVEVPQGALEDFGLVGDARLTVVSVIQPT